MGPPPKTCPLRPDGFGLKGPGWLVLLEEEELLPVSPPDEEAEKEVEVEEEEEVPLSLALVVVPGESVD